MQVFEYELNYCFFETQNICPDCSRKNYRQGPPCYSMHFLHGWCLTEYRKVVIDFEQYKFQNNAKFFELRDTTKDICQEKTMLFGNKISENNNI